MANAADFFTFHDSARLYLQGHDPYLGEPPRWGLGYNLNAPASILIFIPFTLLDVRTAFAVWTSLSVLLLGYVGWRVAKETGQRPLLTICALVISQATFSALQLGQLTALLAALFTHAWIADRDHRPLAAGLLLGVIIGLKPLFVAFALYAVWRGSTRLAAGLVAGLVATHIIGLVVVGPAGYRSWFDVLQRVSWPAHLTNGSLFGALIRLFVDDPDLAITPVAIRAEWVQPLYVVSSCVVIAAGVWTLFRERNRDRDWLIVLFGSLLVSPLGWTYYAPMAIGPLLAYVSDAGPAIRRMAAVGYLLLCVPYTVMNGAYGVLASVVISSASTWGLICLFAAVTVADRRAAAYRQHHAHV